MGSKAFLLIEKYKQYICHAVIEVGSDSPIFKEGSTYYFAHFCKEVGVPFYSIDFDRTAYDRVKDVDGVCAFNMRGEDFLHNTFPQFNHRISFAYLDNYDWIYAKHKFNPPDWMSHMREGYEKYGFVLNNENSQHAHREQAVEVVRFAADICIIVFDDTWCEEDGSYSGKGGTAVPYLLDHGFFLCEKPRFGCGKKHDSYVIVGKGL